MITSSAWKKDVYKRQALAYGLDNESEQKIMVYDLGGGTFDVSTVSYTHLCVRGEIIPQCRQVVTVPEQYRGFFSLHDVIIEHTQCRVGIAGTFGVVLERNDFLFRQIIPADFDVPVGRIEFVCIQTVIFHGDGSQIQAGFVRLFQLINDFFCNSCLLYTSRCV